MMLPASARPALRRLRGTAAALLVIAVAAPAAGTGGGMGAPLPYPFAETEGWTRAAPHLSVNGLPMQVTVAILPKSRDAVAREFRRQWGEPLFAQAGGDALALSRRLHDRFLTVSLSPVDPRHTRAIVSAVRIADLEPATMPRLWDRMPAGSQLVTDTHSQDLNVMSRYVVYTNQASLDVNRDFLIGTLAERSLALEREQPDPRGKERLMLTFGSDSGAQAMAVLHREGQRSVTAVNLTDRLESLQ
jgi:hypothetical protein